MSLRPHASLITLAATIALAAPARAVPAISITSVPAFGSPGLLTGVVTGVVASQYAVATYIEIDGLGWWTKPTAAAPLTPIAANGSFAVNVATGGLDAYATHFLVCLMPTGAAAPVLLGAAAAPLDHAAFVACDVRERFARIIQFAGRSWGVKESPAPVGPGANLFSSDPADVFVDAQGRLHLTLKFTSGAWHCTEVVLLDELGYGTYWFVTDGPNDHLDPAATFGAFTWDSFGGPANREFDFEDSKWCDPIDPLNSQLVVQPFSTPGNLIPFKLPDLSLEARLTRFADWRPDHIRFVVAHGSFSPCAVPTRAVVLEHTYVHDPASGRVVPEPGTANFRFNLWRNCSAGPPAGQVVEAVVSDFRFAPTPGVFPGGSGINPAGSLAVASGEPALGGALTMQLHNPLLTQASGSSAILLLAATGAAGFPSSGLLVPLTNMAGGPGEFLIGPSPPPLAGPVGTWMGAPLTIPLTLPNDPALLGLAAYLQGAILDALPGAAVKVGLSSALELCIH